MLFLKDRAKLCACIILSLCFSMIICNAVSAQDTTKVVFDETGPYGKYFTIYNTGPYGASTFASLLEENGFTVYQLTESPITYSKLKEYDILIVMAPERNYTTDEIDSIKKFVYNGGGLFLLGSNWGVEDGDENYAFNALARSFGVDFGYNTILVDEKDYMGYNYYIKIQNISSNPVTKGINSFYFMDGPPLKNVGNSTVLAYSDPESWADNLELTDEGYSLNNEEKDTNESKGPLPVLASMEYGKGKIIFTGTVYSLTNTFIYRSNGWKLGLNSINWLSNQPIPANYNKTGIISPTVADFEYKILGCIILALIIIALILYQLRRDHRINELKPVKTIKNWKYNSLILLNAIFLLIAALLFFISIYYYNLFDISEIDYYDPYLAYTLIIMGILYVFFTSLIIYNIYHRLRMVAKYSYINIGIIIFFAGFTLIMAEVFPFPTISDYTWQSLVLLIPPIINLWIMRSYGSDLIIEGKEFNRLAKLTSKSLPYELHSIYTDSSYIGEGGFGRVFKAKHKDGREVAIKIPKSFDKRSETIFVSEVSNWRILDHPNIVKLYDFKILPIPYIEMEYCEESVEHGQKAMNTAISIIYEVAHGLSYAHKKNIIHGDVKTSNIMKNQGNYKISDWGLSKVKTDESITLSGATPQYAAPEQISHEFGKADERTDIYQLGTVFYELVTGNLPFKGEMAEIYGSILTTKPENPSKINPDSSKVEKIIMKCLHKNKENRYSSMEELINDLKEFYEPSDSDKTVLFKKKED